MLPAAIKLFSYGGHSGSRQSQAAHALVPSRLVGDHGGASMLELQRVLSLGSCQYLAAQTLQRYSASAGRPSRGGPDPHGSCRARSARSSTAEQFWTNTCHTGLSVLQGG